MSIYGYCRVSTKQQSIERQTRNILAVYPKAVIFSEAYTGTKIDRPEWNKLEKKLRSGDTVIFDSVSRMSRNAEEGFSVYQKLYNKGVSLVFLKEPQINTDTYKNATERQIKAQIETGDKCTDEFINAIEQAVNRFIMALAEKQISLAFEQAQKEVDDLHQRTSEGMKAKNAPEKIAQSKTGMTYTVKKTEKAKAVIRKHFSELGVSMSDSELMKLAGISRNTFYRLKAEIKSE